jgi:hypothetical protein
MHYTITCDVCSANMATTSFTLVGNSADSRSVSARTLAITGWSEQREPRSGALRCWTTLLVPSAEFSKQTLDVVAVGARVLGETDLKVLVR